jgi:hypothetical protein
MPGAPGSSGHCQYGVFWLYNWFQAENNNENNNMNIFFLMNGNIFNYSLALEPYSWSCLDGLSTCSALAIPPNPPGIIFCSPPIGKCELLFAQSYINAYNTAFNQPNLAINQKALKNYQYFYPNDVDNNFINGTFGSSEEYINNNEAFYINYLQDDASMYSGTPSLFVSAGSGGGSGFMYLDWIIVTYGVPYVVSVS